MITRRGIGFVAVAVAAFFIASATRVGWAHIADAVLWGTVILGLAMPWLTIPGLTISRKLQARRSRGLPGPVEGDSATATVSIANGWKMPRFMVSASYRQSSGETSGSSRLLFGAVRRSNVTSTDQQLALERRGMLELGPVTVESSAPFGLFRRRRTMGRGERLLVYPKWVPIERVGILNHALGESEGQSRSRHGVDVSGTRRYAAGDPYRLIHWRNSARSGRLAVKEFDAWSDQAVMIVVDTSTVTGESPESTLDYAARLAGSAARPLMREGGHVSLVSSTAAGRSTSDWASLMADLAMIQRGLGGAAEETLRIAGAGARIIAFVHPASTRLVAAIGHAAQRGAAVGAVVFDGFGADERAQAVVRTLRQSGANVVSCAPGQLEQCARAIETGTAAQESASKVISFSTAPDEVDEVGEVSAA